MKKILSVLLTVSILLMLIPTVTVTAEVVEGACGVNLTWRLDTETGLLEINGTGDMWDWDSSNDTPWNSYRSSIKTVHIVDGVTSIGNNAFAYFSKLTNISIPDSVTSIGSFAIYYSLPLTNISIPSSVVSIGNSAFQNCVALKSIDVDCNNENYKSENGVLYNKKQTILIQYPVGRTDAVFTIPNSVASVGAYAFDSCLSLTEIIIPNSFISIGYRAFFGCTGLKDIAIPDSVKLIENSAFAYCWSLTNITIPDSVEYLGEAAFQYCISLLNVYLPATSPRLENNAFYGVKLGARAIVPYDAEGYGEEGDVWNGLIVTYVTIISITTEEEDGITVKVNRPGQDDAIVVVAIYDAFDRLIQFVTKTIPESGEVILPVAVPSTEVTVKAMMWNDADAMQPFCPPKMVVL